MKMTAIRAERLPPVHRDAMWAVEFRLNAEKLYALSLELRGLWVKTAQFLGARSDVVPPAVRAAGLGVECGELTSQRRPWGCCSACTTQCRRRRLRR
jgi:hypothetical protein